MIAATVDTVARLIGYAVLAVWVLGALVLVGSYALLELAGVVRRRRERVARRAARASRGLDPFTARTRNRPRPLPLLLDVEGARGPDPRSGA